MSERMRCVYCGNVLYSRPYSCCGEAGHCVPDSDESDADPVVRPLRHAYQLGYERGYNAGYDVPPMNASDLKTLRQLLLTHPETGEALFICGAPEREFFGLVRFKVCGMDGSVWTARAGLREGWLTEGQRMQNLRDAVASETAPRPQREPLPGSVLVTMYAECPRSDAEMIEFARAVERAHGIAAKE